VPDRPLTLAVIADPRSVHTRRWVAAFAARGHRVHLFVPRQVADDGDPAPGVEIERYEDYGPRLRPAAALRTVRTLRARLRALDPDVVHAHYVARYGWSAWLAGRHPLVVTAWGSEVLRLGSAGPLTRWLTRRTLRAADVVTVVTDALGRASIEAGARPERVRLIQFGVDGGLFAPGPPPEALRMTLALEGRRVVLAPRWLRPIYRQDVVVRALRDLPVDVAVVFTTQGADPSVLGRMRSLAGTLEVDDRIRFVDGIEHSEMPAYLRLADAIVSVPESDTFPVTAMEAMACGKPLVLSDLPSIREGLADLDPRALAATRTVPAGDAAATATALRELLALSPAARTEAAPALRRAALERGDERRNMDRMEAIYRALAAGTMIP
jgi:glycosyltransferase involved in cell wall biosynthesis